MQSTVTLVLKVHGHLDDGLVSCIDRWGDMVVEIEINVNTKLF